MKHIDNIIFDLGGVILNLRYENFIEQLSEISGKDVGEIYTQQHQTPLFDDYETGRISSQAFRDGLKEMVDVDLADSDIDSVWNSMLLDLPKERIALLQELGKHKPIFLLSNTNAIHIDCFNQIVADTMGEDFTGFRSLFQRAYYSFEMGDRKPHPSIFQSVIDEQGLVAEKTLFIDDTAQHIEGAKKTGLQTIHLTGGQSILDVFSEYAS